MKAPCLSSFTTENHTGNITQTAMRFIVDKKRVPVSKINEVIGMGKINSWVFTRRSQLRVSDLIGMGLSRTDICVYFNLLERADEHGKCFPSYNRIGSDCGIRKRDTVISSVNRLVEVGLVVKDKRNYDEGGGQRSNLYTLVEVIESPKIGWSLSKKRDPMNYTHTNI